MSAELGTKETITRRRAILASVAVVVIFVGVWKFIDYRMRPPPPPSAVIDEKR
jgi:hypothetical protein